MHERNVANLLTVPQAMAIIDSVFVAPRITRVPLMAAQGLRLAEDISLDRDAPAFDKSQMDGYAVRCADITAIPIDLLVIGEITAGTTAERPINAGEAYAIMTGAPMPPGADGVIPVEETELLVSETERKVRITRPAIY